MTLLFIPDTTGLDLREQDRYWSFVRAGKATDYHGIAVHPRHLSWYERLVLKRHLAYDPELDRAQRVEELRALHELRAADVGKEGAGLRGDMSAEEDDELTSSASTYFSEWRDTLSSRDGLCGLVCVADRGLSVDSTPRTLVGHSPTSSNEAHGVYTEKKLKKNMSLPPAAM